MQQRLETKEIKLESARIDIEKEKFNPDNPKHIQYIDQQIEEFKKKLNKLQQDDKGFAGSLGLSLFLFCFTAVPVLTYLVAAVSAGAAGSIGWRRFFEDAPEYKEQLQILKGIFKWSVKTPEQTGKKWALRLAETIAPYLPVTAERYLDHPLYTWHEKEGNIQRAFEKASPEFKDVLEKNALYTIRFFNPQKNEKPVYKERSNTSFIKSFFKSFLYGDYEYKDLKMQTLVPCDEVLPIKNHWW